MGLSDCAKCWETPCRCGHDYEDWSLEELDKQIKMLQAVRDKKSKRTKSSECCPSCGNSYYQCYCGHDDL